MKQSGFSLIELIAVIVILGILAAVAVPKFVNLSEAAKEASVLAVAGSLGSAASLNHANNIAKKANLTASSPLFAVATCPDVAVGLEAGLPQGYSITAGAGTALNGGLSTEGGSATCEVTRDGKSATFVAYAVSI